MHHSLCGEHLLSRPPVHAIMWQQQQQPQQHPQVHLQTLQQQQQQQQLERQLQQFSFGDETSPRCEGFLMQRGGIFHHQQNQAQLDQLASQMNSMELNNNIKDDTSAYFQTDPYSQQARRRDPVYASMASHFSPDMMATTSGEESSSGGSSPSQSLGPGLADNALNTGSSLLKRPDLVPRCHLQFIWKIFFFSVKQQKNPRFNFARKLFFNIFQSLMIIPPKILAF